MLCCIQCHLFNKDSWQCGKACVTIPQWYPCAKARTDSYFYFHPSLLYVMAVTFNVTVHVTVEISSVGLVQSAFYWPRSTALDAVKCEIPPITTVMTSRDSDISRIVNTKGCVTDLFLELTGLLREQSIKHQACLNMHMKVRNTTTPVGVHQCLRLTLQTFPQPFKMILKERYKLKSVGLIR